MSGLLSAHYSVRPMTQPLYREHVVSCLSWQSAQRTADYLFELELIHNVEFMSSNRNHDSMPPQVALIIQYDESRHEELQRELIRLKYSEYGSGISVRNEHSVQ